MTASRFRLGFIINPVAGLGGSVALKGSDGADTVAQARALGARPRAAERAAEALALLKPWQARLTILTAAGEMGQQLAEQLGFEVEVVYQPGAPTTPEDTENCAARLLQQGIDLLLFAGGDGTARNICRVVGERCPVLGIPAGCKIHSGVYAVTPKAAGKVVGQLLSGELVSLTEADVMDIDEAAFRQGQVRARRYGEMRVPQQHQYVQAVKMGGREVDELVLQDIAAWVIEQMDDDCLYVMGSGSTVAFIMEELGLENTLLGVDLVYQQQVVGRDMTAQALARVLPRYEKRKLIITLIGGQGHIFGRGNQQLSAEVIRLIGRDNIMLVATRSKLKGLMGRPLIVDTGDAALNRELSGLMPVICGYNDQLLYPVASPGEEDD